MKTEAEIRSQLTTLREWQDSIISDSQMNFTSGLVDALLWVLGEEMVTPTEQSKAL